MVINSCLSARALVYRNFTWQHDTHVESGLFSSPELREDEQLKSEDWRTKNTIQVPYSNQILYVSRQHSKLIMQCDPGSRSVCFSHAQLWRDVTQLIQISPELFLMQYKDDDFSCLGYGEWESNWTIITGQG